MRRRCTTSSVRGEPARASCHFSAPEYPRPSDSKTGLDRQRRIPESYSTTRLDHWDLAERIPGALPAAIQQQLSMNPLLFLGHGLAAPDIESLVRFAHRDHHGPRSWAVVLNNEGVEYWRQCGIEIVDQPVDLYVTELHRRLATNGASSGGRQLTGKLRQKSRRA